MPNERRLPPKTGRGTPKKRRAPSRSRSASSGGGGGALVANLLSWGLGGFTVLALIVLAVFWLPKAAQKARKDLARAEYMSQNLERMGTAHGHFRDVYVSVAPHVGDREPPWKGHAWPVPLLPFLEQSALYEKIDVQQPWDADVNREPFGMTLIAFRSRGIEEIKDDRGYALMHFAANEHVVNATNLRPRDVTNGMSNTAYVGDAAGNFRPWGDPANVRDPMDGINAGPGTFGRVNGNGCHMLMLDGSVRELSNGTSPDALAAMSHPYPPRDEP